jgi:hypothetical protein
MFVASVLDDFWKKLDNRHNQKSEWRRYLQAQRNLWGPEDLFERSCPRWLGSGRLTYHISHHGGIGFEPVKEQEWKACPGGCKKCHPSITLFFDTTQKKTVATISMRLEPFVKCLDQMVREGRAVQKTPLYYVLDGYIRENETLLREHKGFSSHLVDVAMGALESSDKFQRKELEATDNKCKRPQKAFSQLEEVLEICRLHRMEEDLDVMSIYCMRRANKMMGRVAARMATKRVQDTKLSILPLVDGCSLSGFSVFRRHTGDSENLVQTEHGRLVEYVKGREIVLQSSDTLGSFQPSDLDSFQPCKWNCEELSFAQLEREWGDIGYHEYVGQKILVEWTPSLADRNHLLGIDSEESCCFQLASVKMNATPNKSLKSLNATKFLTIDIDISESLGQQVDEVTVRYSGQLQIERIQLDFLGLVTAYARSLERTLKVRYTIIEKSRPLMNHEMEFLQEVKKAARF